MSDEYYLSPVEIAIRQAMAEGQFDNLPGEGKPLRWLLEDDTNVPDEMRLAYKVMRDNDILPAWMMEYQLLDHQQERILSELARGYRAYQGTLQAAERTGDLGKCSRALRGWAHLLDVFGDAIRQYNQRVLAYNLKVPPGVSQRHFLDIDQLVGQLEAPKG